MGQSQILEELLQLLSRPEIPTGVRAAIASELGNKEYRPAKRLLMEGLKDPNSNMRSTCIRALGTQMEEQDSGPTILNVLLNDEYEHVKIDAAYALGTLRYRQALPALKEAVLNESYSGSLREAAYEAILMVLGKHVGDLPRLGKPIAIDWNLVDSL